MDRKIKNEPTIQVNLLTCTTTTTTTLLNQIIIDNGWPTPQIARKKSYMYNVTKN